MVSLFVEAGMQKAFWKPSKPWGTESQPNLGYNLEEGKLMLYHDCISTILWIPAPTLKRRMKIHGHRWILLAIDNGICWESQASLWRCPWYVAFGMDWDWAEGLQILEEGPSVCPNMSDITKSFYLYLDEARHIAKGVLMQILGLWKRPVVVEYCFKMC